MAITPTQRFALKQYGSGGDPHPNRAEFNAMIDAIENNAAMFSQGVTTSRPPAGKRGRFYYDEDADRIFYDNGTAWKDGNPNGGGGAGAALAIGGAGSEGVSKRSARADHTHPLPLATGAAHGAMSSGDKTKLDAATDAATANTLARRNADGRLSISTPTAAGHAANKSYVDGVIDEVADYIDAGIAGQPQIVTGSLLAGAVKPADKPWKIFEGMVRTTTGAGGENRAQNGATDVNGYGGLWFGFQGLPTFQGIYGVQLTGYHSIESFQYLPTLADITIGRIKWRGRRLDNSNWAHGYANVDIMVKVFGW